MTPPRFDTALPLHTDSDVLRRVRDLVGPATSDHQLWVMLVDGDDRQTPVIMPISDVPRVPDALVDGLTTVLSGLRDDLRTAAGSGSAIFTLERHGVDAVLPTDRAWATALAAACVEAGIGLRGFFLSMRGGVRRV